MAATSSAPQNKQASFPNPPRRGQIKAQIFNGLVKSVASAVSKAAESLGKFAGNGANGGGDGDGAGGSSASSTPPPSGYNTES